MTIKNNVHQLTQAEREFILASSFFTYVQGVGLIFLEKGTWDCSDSVGALKYLRENGIREVK